MDKFLKYFEDPNFVRWVIHPTKELDNYWSNYVKNNNSEKEQINTARLILLHLKSKTNGPELKNISDKIYTSTLKHIQIKKRKTTPRIILLRYMKYAAIGIFFFVLGVTVNHFTNQDKQDELYGELQAINLSEYSTLILSDGSNVQLPDKSSDIEYKSNGQIIINHKDTVQSKKPLIEQDQNVLFVPYGKNASIKLSDGTVAYLNAGSRLVYPNTFDGETRTVSLIGEGYFDVAHNAEMPFIVKTHKLNIEVLGTRFDLSAYPNDNIVETILVEGKVKITKPGLLFGNEEYILEPNQRAAYNIDTKNTKITNVDVEKYVTWHKGYLIFETQELNRVIKKLERYYNIRIDLIDPTLGFLRLTGKLELKEDKRTVLNVLAKTASVDLIQTNESEYVLK